MAITKNQLQANEDFFNNILSFSKIYMWPDAGATYIIIDNKFHADKSACDYMKKNVSPSFWSKIVEK